VAFDRAVYDREWRQRNRDKVNAASRKYRQRNLEKRRVVIQAWRKANPEKVKAQRQREYRKHKVKMDAAKTQWRRDNPEKAKIARKTAYGRRRAREKGAPVNDFTAAQWLQVKQWYQQRCAYCSQPKPLTQDHIQPLSRGGSHTISNIVPACKSCNSSKGNRPAHDFVTLEQFNWPVLQPAPPAA